MKTALFTKVFGDRSLNDAVKLAADVGYDAVELMCREPHLDAEIDLQQARDLRARLDALGLDVACLATYTGNYLGDDESGRRRTLRELERFLELSEVIGCPRVRHGPGQPPAYKADDEDYAESARWMRRAAELAAEYDAELLVEIHSNTLVESAVDAREFTSLVGRENIGVIHDAGNMYISDVDYGAASVATLDRTLEDVHVKDERRVNDGSPRGSFELPTVHGIERFQPRLLGKGEVDHGPLFTALANRGYDGYITSECHVPPDDSLTDVDIARHELSAIEQLWSRATSA